MNASSHDSFSSSATAINTPGINTPENLIWDSALYGDCTSLAIQYGGQTSESQERWMHQMNSLELPSRFETHFTHSPFANNAIERTPQNLDFHKPPCDSNHDQTFRTLKSEHLNDGRSLTLNTTTNSNQHIAISVSRASKRKPACTVATRPDDEHRPVKKTAHNMIEKRYRNKLNDSIAELRDNIPSLRMGGLGMGKEGDPIPKLYKVFNTLYSAGIPSSG